MGVVFLTTLVGWIGFSLPFPVFSHLFLRTEHGLMGDGTPDTLRTLYFGIALALYPLGQILGAPFLGRLSDRVGRKPVLVWSLAATVIGSLILALGVLEGSLFLVFFGRFLSGVSEGSLAIAQSLAADVSSEETKARNFAWIGIAIDLGFIAGPLIGGILADTSVFPWTDISFPFWLASFLFLLNVFVVAFLLRETSQKKSEHQTERGIMRMLFSKALFRSYLLSFAAFWAIMIFLEYFAVYFVQVFQTPPAELGLYAALVSLPLILAGLVVNRVVGLLGNRRTCGLSLLLMAIGLLLFIQAESLLGLVLPMVIICIGVNFGQTATSVVISNAASENEQGQAMGIYRSVTVAAGGISALVGGSLAGLSPDYPFLTAIAACVIAGFFLPGREKSRLTKTSERPQTAD